MMLPNVQGRIVTTNLMRDAVAAQAKFIRSHSAEIFNLATPAA